VNKPLKQIISIFFLSSMTMGFSQELEPKAITNLPVGTNFLVASYSFSQGDILLDPAVTIEDLNANIHRTIFGYVRSINFLGLSSKLDVIIPFAFGDWED